MDSSDKLLSLKSIPSYDDDYRDDYKDFDFDDEEDTKSSTTMKRTKEPAGIKHIKDIIAEDHTVKLKPYRDRPWRKLF